MKPRASFVIPAFNQERWISKAIYSCRTQSIKQIEIIVVNDGSTDGTSEIIHWHAKEDKRVIPIDLPENAGRSAARNIGNAKASSDLIFVLDADDMAARSRVKDTIAAFQLKKADLVYGSFFTVDTLGSVQAILRSDVFNPEAARKEKVNGICHSTVAYRKEVADKIRYDVGIFSELGLDDWKFQWDAHKAGYVFANVRSPLSYYRMTEDGISVNRKPEEVLKAKEEYLATL